MMLVFYNKADGKLRRLEISVDRETAATSDPESIRSQIGLFFPEEVDDIDFGLLSDHVDDLVESANVAAVEATMAKLRAGTSTKEENIAMLQMIDMNGTIGV